MREIEVKVVRLDPMHVAAAYGFGERPEDQAWQQVGQFVKQAGLENDGQRHRYFGFNNPSPTPGSPNYGYEQWITLAPETETIGAIKIKEFDGGLYAITPCKLSRIGETWQQLAAWLEKSTYRLGKHQWLEECLQPSLEKSAPEVGEENIEMVLYMPITE